MQLFYDKEHAHFSKKDVDAQPLQGHHFMG